jgi:hypothetical protein
MKTITIVLLWFVFIGVLATVVSCSSAHQCDAYGQQQTLNNNKNLS